MQLIKNAITYHVELPSNKALGAELEKFEFQELASHDFCSSGFESMFDGFFVEPFAGGYAFRLRYDEKIIPESIIRDRLKERIAEIEKDEERVVQTMERKEIRERIYNSMLPVALYRTHKITCFYHIDTKTMIVDTSNKKLADVVTGKLVKAMGSIKATTIYISGITKGLTAKISSYLDGDDHAFDGFEVGGQCKLKGDGLAASFKNEYLSESKEGIVEAIKGGLKIVELSLSGDLMDFRINSDYIIKGIVFVGDAEESSFDDERDMFTHEAAAQVAIFADVNKALCKLFEYKEAEEAQAA